MKTKLIILLFLSCLSCFAQYTLIPDVNFEKSLIELAIDNDGLNGKVLTSRINKLRSLDVSSYSITNLAGIQDFIALTELYCEGNQLTNLDVSKNKALTLLNCNYNQLTNLNVSKNISLTDLSCGTNQLTNLDVSKNIALTKLSCNSNQLTNLDLSMNIGLIGLGCDSNQLKNLDVSKNIDLIYLGCYSNQLISLNLKNGNNVNFRISFIDFTENPNLDCIQVDDADYSNKNWARFKDATTSYKINCH